jgi:hypothetical protein
MAVDWRFFSANYFLRRKMPFETIKQEQHRKQTTRIIRGEEERLIYAFDSDHESEGRSW